MKDQRVYLKVKLKSLMAEAKIIRTEEKRNKYHRNGLALHRRTILRNESRHTFLAYGFLRGRTYQQIEKSQRPADWDKVRKMVEKYGVSIGDFDTLRDYAAAKDQQTAAFEAWKPKQPVA